MNRSRSGVYFLRNLKSNSTNISAMLDKAFLQNDAVRMNEMFLQDFKSIILCMFVTLTL